MSNLSGCAQSGTAADEATSNLHDREGKALTNFQRTLPPEGSDMAEQNLRDSYDFDFITLTDDFKERQLERGLCCANSAGCSIPTSFCRLGRYLE